MDEVEPTGRMSDRLFSSYLCKYTLYSVEFQGELSNINH